MVQMRWITRDDGITMTLQYRNLVDGYWSLWRDVPYSTEEE